MRKKAAEKKQKADEKKAKFLSRQKAIEEYKRKKAEKFKEISKKTRKGQPVMAGRMKLLLDKIQKMQ